MSQNIINHSQSEAAYKTTTLGCCHLATSPLTSSDYFPPSIYLPIVQIVTCLYFKKNKKTIDKLHYSVTRPAQVCESHSSLQLWSNWSYYPRVTHHHNTIRIEFHHNRIMSAVPIIAVYEYYKHVLDLHNSRRTNFVEKRFYRKNVSIFITVEILRFLKKLEHEFNRYSSPLCILLFIIHINNVGQKNFIETQKTILRKIENFICLHKIITMIYYYYIPLKAFKVQSIETNLS
ncbi:hypothetical protein AGLY_015026 [Aphis glycines]|uniref:Uncharacterized protein n=1 Tax=Aphis glycines TaxID=307491 RepID=A0A6G0T2W2_APHGL|nr:hypothetical protein AGLY_015026 [Aphis glycines]